MSANKESYDQLLVIFGASGDLTSRKLLPAFSELFSRGLLPDRFAILGAARSDFSDISFRRSRRQVLKGDRADEFLGKVYYLRFDPASGGNCVCRIGYSTIWPRRPPCIR